MSDMNLFRVLADISHTASKCILIWAIHSNRSAEGVSLLTQILYIFVFGSRYLDLFWVPPQRAWWWWWNLVLKIFFISTSAYVVFIMTRVFARTREKETAWRLTTWSLMACLVTAPIITLIYRGWQMTVLTEVLWTFSIELESVCVLPQLLLLRQTTVPTVIDSFYLVTLGSYRFFYLLSWIVRGASHQPVDAISVAFGVIQTLFYCDFAWVYWTRQRVKLRGGGVVDGDDLSKSFLVRRFIGGERVDQEVDDDETEDALARQENGVISSQGPRAARHWGKFGKSISADDPDLERDGRVRDSNMADPSTFEDDEFDEDADASSAAATQPAKGTRTSKKSDPIETAGATDSSAAEWRRNE